MLVLTRRIGQQIVIDENTRITIQRISGKRVTVTIDAPEDVRILRGELETDCIVDEANHHDRQTCQPPAKCQSLAVCLG